MLAGRMRKSQLVASKISEYGRGVSYQVAYSTLMSHHSGAICASKVSSAARSCRLTCHRAVGVSLIDYLLQFCSPPESLYDCSWLSQSQNQSAQASTVSRSADLLASQ